MLEDAIRKLVEELQKLPHGDVVSLPHEEGKPSPKNPAKNSVKETPAKPEIPAEAVKMASEADIDLDPPRDLWNDQYNSVETDIEVLYDADTGKYFVNDREYQEGEAAWISLDFGEDFGCNYDPDQPLGTQFAYELVPFHSFYEEKSLSRNLRVSIIPPVDEMGNCRPLLRNEADLDYALRHCLEFDTPGFFVFCREGKFFLLVQSHYYFDEDDEDFLVCIFNARRCKSGYRKAWTTLAAEVDGLPLETDIRYMPGQVVAWDEEMIAELKEELKHDAWPFDDDDY